MSSKDLITEKVPDFKKRLGDQVIQGSNNTIIVFGTDRPSSPSSGLGHINAAGKGVGTGTVHIIAGRSGSDPDFNNDKSFLYISSKTDTDTNLGLSSAGPISNGTAAVIGKSDVIRYIARNDIKFVIEKSQTFIFINKDSIIINSGVNKITMSSAGVEVVAPNVIVNAQSIMMGNGGKPLVTADILPTLIAHTHILNLGTGMADASPNLPAISANSTIITKAA